MDLVAGSGLDLVIVSAPMSQASGWPSVRADALVRQSLGVRLRSEVAALRRAGVPVVTIEPDRQVARAMGLNPVDARPRGAVSRVTRRRVGDWLSGPGAGRWLAATLGAAAAETDHGAGPGAHVVVAARRPQRLSRRSQPASFCRLLERRSGRIPSAGRTRPRSLTAADPRWTPSATVCASLTVWPATVWRQPRPRLHQLSRPSRQPVSTSAADVAATPAGLLLST